MDNTGMGAFSGLYISIDSSTGVITSTVDQPFIITFTVKICATVLSTTSCKTSLEQTSITNYYTITSI